MITDKLASYGAAKREVVPSVEHRKQKRLNNRAENSHQPTRRRERQMKRFKSAGQAQCFLSAHDGINNLFHLLRHQVPATQYRASRTKAFRVWAEVTGVAAAAQLRTRRFHRAPSQPQSDKSTMAMPRSVRVRDTTIDAAALSKASRGWQRPVGRLTLN